MLKPALALCVVIAVLATVAVWLIPVEAAQNWAFLRAGEDPYAQFEAVGQAEAIWWLARCGLPLASGLLIVAAFQLDRVEAAIQAVFQDFLRLSASTTNQSLPPSRMRAVRTWTVRFLVGCWLVLAGSHALQGVLQRTRDWPYYHFRSGAEVLPNISDSNRDVIRYLRQATPPGSRILVFSDQKLFFLSYYLLPRRLFHPVHEESEFVIPLANQARQLSAYRLEEMPEGYVDSLHPDFILNYFEGARYNDIRQRGRDPQWVRFWQTRNGSGELPPYVVELRPVQKRGAP
jgi:hypothetical protein